MRGYCLALFGACAIAVELVIPPHVKTRSEPLVFAHDGDAPKEYSMYLGTTVSSYSSPAITLKTGEAWFSLPDVTVMPMPQPGVPYAIVAMKYDIVEEATGRSVPLSEMYSHHWLVYDKLIGSNGYNIGCGGPDSWVSNVYGAGGEMRGIDYVYRPGYGYISADHTQHWSANIHFIRTEDLSTEYFDGSYGAALKSCIECEYAPGKGVGCVKALGDGVAIFGCCFDGSRCPVNNKKDKTAKKYRLTYNITWTTDVQHIKKVRTFVIDGFNCGILTNLVPNTKKPKRWTECFDKYCLSNGTVTMPTSGTIMWAYNHQHVGAINGTLSVNGVPRCTSYPHYGTDPHDAPGNEKGYTVGFHMCVDPGRADYGDGIRVEKGDKLTLTAYYSVDPADERALPIPGGSHTGTMNLFYFMLHEDEAPSSDEYACVNNECVQNAAGVPLKTCQAACGGAAALV